MESWLDSVDSLEKFKTYQRFKEAAGRKVRVNFMEKRPKHLK